MRPLTKPVKRRTTTTYDHRARPLIVMLLPGDVIAFRELRQRSTYSAPLMRVYQQVIQWNLNAQRTTKRRTR